MKPIEFFELAWERCDHISAIHAYIANNVSGAVEPDELLRAEWVARLSALDLYVHELVSQRMLEAFLGQRRPATAFLRFRISNETLVRIHSASTITDKAAAFDLDIRTQLARETFQSPEKIAEAIRLCSDIELWNEIAIQLGATQSTKNSQAKALKKSLSLLVERRNKIAHEADLQPSLPRNPWPIAQNDLHEVSTLVEQIVRTIDPLIP